jgi:AraC family transcriptional regulator
VAKVFDSYSIVYTSPRPSDAALLSVLSIGHYKAHPGFKLDRAGGHSAEHVIYTIAGEAQGVIAGERSTAKAGSVWLMPKDKPYRYWCDETSWEGRWTEYDGAWARKLWTMMNLDGVTHVPRCFEAQGVVEDLHARLKKSGNRGLHEASGLLWKLFTVLERIVSDKKRAQTSFSGIQAAQQFVAEHLSDPIVLDDLAGAAKLSSFHFARVFRGKTGFTPAAYVRSVRISRARELLRQGDLSIKQIGQAVGYPHAHHFSAVFKQAAGVSPREFLRAHLGKL